MPEPQHKLLKERKKFSSTLKNPSATNIPQPRCKLCGKWFFLISDKFGRTHHKMLICDECRETKKDIIPHAVHKAYAELTPKEQQKAIARTNKWIAMKRQTDPEWRRKTNQKVGEYNKQRRLVDDAFRIKQNHASRDSSKRRYHNDSIFAEKEKKIRRVRYARQKALSRLRYLDKIW